MTASKFPVVLSMLTAVILASCGLGPYESVDALIDIDEKRVLIVPLAVETDQQRMRWFESQTGLRIANGMSDLIRQNADCVLLDPAPLKAALRRSRLSDPNWKELQRAEKADILVACRIIKYSLQDPRNRGFLQGRAVIEIKVLGEDGVLLMNQTLPPIIYPKPNSVDPDFNIPGGTTLRLTPEGVRAGLEARVTEKLAQIFYDHHIPRD